MPDWHEYHGLTCEEIEAKENDKFLHPLLMNAVTRSKVLVEDIRKGGVRAAIEKVRRDRQAVVDLTVTAAGRALEKATFQDKWRLWDALDTVRQELRNK